MLIGTLQCDKYEAIIEHRQTIAQCYYDHLDSQPDFLMPPKIDGATYSQFVIRTPYAAELSQQCRQNGFQLGSLINYHTPDHHLFKNDPYFGRGEAQKWPGNLINLPVHRAISPSKAAQLAMILTRQLQSAQNSRDKNPS